MSLVHIFMFNFSSYKFCAIHLLAWNRWIEISENRRNMRRGQRVQRKNVNSAKIKLASRFGYRIAIPLHSSGRWIGGLIDIDNGNRNGRKHRGRPKTIIQGILGGIDGGCAKRVDNRKLRSKQCHKRFTVTRVLRFVEGCG